MEQRKALIPIYIAIALCIGLLLGFRLQGKLNTSMIGSSGGDSLIDEVVNLVRANYVDPVEQEALYGSAIVRMMENLDPHSVYIPVDEMQGIEEEMSGNFEGIGIEFFVLNDTIQVVTPLSGGPSEQIGLLAGDKIVKINDSLVAGVEITNLEVMRKLKGPKGTKVKVSVKRDNSKNLTDYTITRDKIPLYSVDAGFMLDANTGYVKINRFSSQTYTEFMEKALPLQKKGMKHLILDLRQNPGGYLGEATKIADEFLDGKKEIVYTEGRNFPKQYFKAGKAGDFEDVQLSILVDEGSASASEILAGAIQDWDRGLIIGRRSFGKGLVQEQYPLQNGSALRLTVAKYYTPSGRCIQKTYENGMDAYNEEMLERFERGEIYNRDSIHNDSLQVYKTKLLKRTVYGGGGITPDIFVALDTSYFSQFVSDVVSTNLISRFAYDYYAAHQKMFDAFKSSADFSNSFNMTPAIYNEFVSYAISKGITGEKAAQSTSVSAELSKRIKAYIAKRIWQNEGFFHVLAENDKAVRQAMNEFTRNNRLGMVK